MARRRHRAAADHIAELVSERVNAGVEVAVPWMGNIDLMIEQFQKNVDVYAEAAKKRKIRFPVFGLTVKDMSAEMTAPEMSEVMRRLSSDVMFPDIADGVYVGMHAHDSGHAEAAILAGVDEVMKLPALPVIFDAAPDSARGFPGIFRVVKTINEKHGGASDDDMQRLEILSRRGSRVWNQFSSSLLTPGAPWQTETALLQDLTRYGVPGGAFDALRVAVNGLSVNGRKLVHDGNRWEMFQRTMVILDELGRNVFGGLIRVTPGHAIVEESAIRVLGNLESGAPWHGDLGANRLEFLRGPTPSNKQTAFLSGGQIDVAFAPDDRSRFAGLYRLHLDDMLTKMIRRGVLPQLSPSARHQLLAKAHDRDAVFQVLQELNKTLGWKVDPSVLREAAWYAGPREDPGNLYVPSEQPAIARHLAQALRAGLLDPYDVYGAERFVLDALVTKPEMALNFLTQRTANAKRPKDPEGALVVAERQWQESGSRVLEGFSFPDAQTLQLMRVLR